jgi:hypothetical protein
MTADTIIQRNEALKSARQNFAVLWDDAARWILPRKGNIITKTSPGSDQASELFDSTAEEAALIYAAGLLSSLTPAGEQWMRLEPSDPDAPETVKAFLARASERVQETLLASNFYLTAHEAFIDSGVFCTVCMFTGESNRTGVSFTNIPVGTFCVAENNEGFVDTVYREWSWTARQALQEWGREKLGEKVQKALDDAKWDQEFTFIHAVEPRLEFEEGVQLDPKKRRFASLYVCKEDKHLIDEGGYYEFPYAVLRTLRSNNELYGRGPGLQILPEAKLVNRIEKDLLVAVEKMVDPPWLMPDDAGSRPDNRPNGVTYWDTSNPNNKPEQLQLTNRVDLGESKSDQKRARIRQAFFVDMFQMLTNLQEQRREKTAFEVAEMLQEKLVLFTPIFARTVQEFLNPTLERVFAILLRAGKLGDVPPELQGLDYRISYVSKIALALKTARTSSLAQVMNMLGSMVVFDPSVKHIVDWRKAARDVANNYALPTDWQRSELEVEEIVAGETEAAMQMQQAALAKDITQSARNLGPEAQKAATQTIVNAGAGQN